MQECAVYVHWPFCKFKCPYCDFNSHVREAIDQDRLLQAYLKEISYHKLLFQRYRIKSIFFGGGTPSLAAPKVISAIIDAIFQYNCATNIEVTLEANPTSVENSKLVEYKAAGVNRVSIGVQSFNQDNLKFLGRQHTVGEAQNAIKLAAQIFDNYTFDLMYTLPHQTLEDWVKELTAALPLIQHHVSLYQLTIEKGTEFYSRVKHKEFVMPSDNLSADFYNATQEIVERVNLQRYEVSNHAVPGRECLHNLNYWQYGDYVGIGAGAHSRYEDHTCDGVAVHGQASKIATVNWHLPEKWLTSVEQHGHSIQNRESLTIQQQYQEMLLMGLRLTNGVSSSAVLRTSALSNMLQQGWLCESDGRIKIPKQHTLLTEQIIKSLLLCEE
ncbi:radical SAM family heme chaperone HemW [Rickettsiales endosymbiont of Peranema trichophorum]|uniref:radical SAM family heme chaperone HemW n=1 Tax=Rickettsiales endosymbiont of Peranema trichophorum TaxID=2486577 RepID=UPI0013EE458D|nr:radical SAM family heme chaperone HemW [Rickettsiales endosymbiont of Peranema trichophorum]